jgi:hypothetical protein
MGTYAKVPLPRVLRDQSTNHVACTVGKSKRDAFTDTWGVNKMCLLTERRQDAFTDTWGVNKMHLLTDTGTPHATGYLPDPRIPGYDNP